MNNKLSSDTYWALHSWKWMVRVVIGPVNIFKVVFAELHSLQFGRTKVHLEK